MATIWAAKASDDELSSKSISDDDEIEGFQIVSMDAPP
jgi:hypothetical protein